MKNKTFTSLLLIFILTISIGFIQSAQADGCIITPDYERFVYLPEQKAALFWDGTNETMILSTKISSETIDDMAWVIPIPSSTAPQVEKGDITVFDDIAFEFGGWDGGDHYFDFPLEFCLLSLFMFLMGFIGLLYLLRKNNETSNIGLLFSVIFIVISILIGIYSSMVFSLGGYDEVYDVDVIEFKTVDIYDVAILKADNASEIISWSQANNFNVSAEAETILQEYCNQNNFYFIINKINFSNMYNTTEEIQQAKQDLASGIETPLEITFQPEQLFYPMKISQINKGNTRIHVYVITNQSVIDDTGLLLPEEIKEAQSGSILPAYNSGTIITFLSYEGPTENLHKDSYFSLT